MIRPQNIGEKIPIKKGRVGSLTVYEITDYELEQLEKGSPSSIYLNFSIFLLTIAIAFLISILTTKIDSIKIFNIFIIVIIIGFVIGFILLILWYRGKKSIKSIIKKIRARIED